MYKRDDVSVFILEDIEEKNADQFFCDGKVGETSHYVTSSVQCRCNACLEISGYSVNIPVVYLFEYGVSMHLCIQLELDTVYEYLQKWAEASNDLKYLYRRVNPLMIKTSPSIIINEIPLHCTHRSETFWIPNAQAYHMSNPPEGEVLLQRYNLDRQKAWLFQRIQCPWEKSDMSRVETIQFRLSLRCPPILGPIISNFEINKNYSFYYPGLNTKHNLIILAYKTGLVDQGRRTNTSCEKFMTEICYSVLPNQNRPLLEIVCRDNPQEQSKVVADGTRTSILSTSVNIKSPHHDTARVFHDKRIEEVEMQLLLFGVEQHMESEVMNSTG